MAVAVVSVSFAAILFRLSGVAGFPAAAWRLGIGSLVTLVILFLLGGPERGIRPRDMGLMVLGGLALALHFGFWFISLEHIRVGPSTLIVDAYPAVLAIIGHIFFGERYGYRDVVGSLLAIMGLAGMIITTYGYELTTPGGDVVVGLVTVLISLAMVTTYFIIGKFMRLRIGTWTYTSIVYPSAFLATLVITLGTGESLLPPSPESYIYLVLLGIVPMIGGHTVINYLLPRLRSLTVTIPVITEPIGASLLAYIVLGETLPLEASIWIGITVLGVGLVISSEEAG